jgi:AraC-like DNA-binding protein/quercetin dioxygenase-like cupin family protein
MGNTARATGGLDQVVAQCYQGVSTMCGQSMYMTRQAQTPTPFKILRRTFSRGEAVGSHAHEEAQVIFAASGTLQVYTETGRWFVPPQLALWMPARIPHRIDVLSDTELRMLYWHPSALRKWAPERPLDYIFVLAVTPLLRELILTAFKVDIPSEKAELAVRLILHEFAETPDLPVFLPMPTSAIGRRVADLTLADSQARLGLSEIACLAATSIRTISRLFPVETGLTFKVWRQRARIALAIDRLSAGCAISQVAADVGFGSTTAFSFAFRQVNKMTPTAFLNHFPRLWLPLRHKR